MIKTRHVTKLRVHSKISKTNLPDLIMSDAVQDRYAISQQMDSPWAYLYFYFFSVT